MAQDRFIDRSPVSRGYTLKAEGPLHHAKLFKRKISLTSQAAILGVALSALSTFGLIIETRDQQTTPNEPAPSNTDKSPKIETPVARVPLGALSRQFLPGNELGEKIQDMEDRLGISTRLLACFPESGQGSITGTVINELPFRNLPHTRDAQAGSYPAGTRLEYTLVARTLADSRNIKNRLPLNEWAVLQKKARSAASVFAAIFYGDDKVSEDQPKICSEVYTSEKHSK